jgi:hypothetical protein
MRGVPFAGVTTAGAGRFIRRRQTAINQPLGKNMIGAFYQPQLVRPTPKTCRRVNSALVWRRS